MALDVVVVGGGLAGLSAARDLAAGGADVVDTGWGLVVYHHDADGKWRVARDAFATDTPLPTK